MKSIFGVIISLWLIFCSAASVTTPAKPKEQINWPFEGIFGYFDKQSIQRGFQVYKEVCQVCHSLKYLHYEDLGNVGFSSEEIKAIADSYQVQDSPNDEGKMFERPGRPSDLFVSPFPNEKAARAANNGSDPPDLSLIIKARKDGANYVYSLLTGYTNAPEGFHMNDGLYYNPYFAGRQIAMPPPMTSGQVQYGDGTDSSLEQMSEDVVNFLQWAAEPEMQARKVLGLKVLLYLVIFTVLFYLVKKKIWKDVK